MLRPFIFVAAALLFCCVTAFAAPADDFAAGNTAFQQKDYAKAIESYNRALAQGVESAPLYYNLGNAYFKNKDLGLAIVNYLKARRLDPTDNDIRTNLEFAKHFTSVQLEGAQLNPIRSTLNSVLGPFKLSALAWVSSLLFVLFIGLLIVRYGFGIYRGGLKALAWTVAIIVVVACLVTTYKYENDYGTRWGVIVAEQAQVHTGPSEQSDLELRGEPGLVVEILSESGDYFNVLFENQRRGWVKKTLVAEV